MSTDVRTSQEPSAALYLVATFGALVALGQAYVVFGFFVGWFLVSPSLTDARIANREDEFEFSTVTSFVADAWTYALVIGLMAVLVSLVWGYWRQLHPAVSWCALAAVILVVPARLTILSSVFN